MKRAVVPLCLILGASACGDGVEDEIVSVCPVAPHYGATAMVDRQGGV